MAECDPRTDRAEKHWVVFEASSHRANFERPADYAALLDEVVAATGGR